jgi:DNA topoisomerase-1
VCRAGKKAEDNLFDLIDPTKVNKHLQELMPGLTIKVFRTYNASITLSRMLKDTDNSLDVAGKKAQVRGGRVVACVCFFCASAEASCSAPALAV